MELFQSSAVSKALSLVTRSSNCVLTLKFLRFKIIRLAPVEYSNGNIQNIRNYPKLLVTIV